MTRLLIVIEKANGNYSAYSPDVPGCVATGATHEEARQNMEDALALLIAGLVEEGLPVPRATAVADYVTVE